MSNRETPAGRFDQLNVERQVFLTRCEDYAALTIPALCPRDYYNYNNTELSLDWQSLGGQAVNHLANKLLLTLFSPSRPFFRLEPSRGVVDQFKSMMEVSEDDIAETLSNAEREAIKVMNKAHGGKVRAKLLRILQHLIAIGNVCTIMDKKQFRVIPVKGYVVKRDIYGNWIEGIIKDCVKVSQLDKEIQASPALARKKPDDKVFHYQWYRRNPETKDIELTQWVDNDQLPKKFSGKWPEMKCPVRFLTWDLADGQDYGQGHVELSAADLRALSVLSEAQIKGAVLASEFRWLVNPAGQTSVEDMQSSENGSAIPGAQGDITPLNSGTGQVLQYMNVQIQQLVANIGRNFLMASATTRQAERVTAIEIQRDAAELETSLGGAYSRIAVDLQIPLAYFLLDEIKLEVDGKSLEPIVITGMDALSRGQDVENLMGFVAAIAQLQQLNPNANLMGLLDVGACVKLLASGMSVDSTRYMSKAEQQQQVQEQALAAPGPGVNPSQAAAQQAATQQAPPPSGQEI